MKKVMAKSGVKKAQNGMSTKTAKAKPMAKKAPAKMAMKKTAVKKAQEGMSTDSIKAMIDKKLQERKPRAPYNIGKELENELQKKYKEDQQKENKAKAERIMKDAKEAGFSRFKQKNGGKIKR